MATELHDPDHPDELVELIHRLDSYGKTADIAVLHEILPLFETVLNDPTTVPILVHHELARMLMDPTYSPPVLNGKTLQINDATDGRMRLLLTISEGRSVPDQSMLVSEASHVLFGSFDATFTHEEFIQPNPRSEVLDRSSRLEPGPTRTLSPLKPYIFEATMGARIVLTPERSCVLRIVQTAALPYVWQYDLETRLPLRAIAVELAHSRVEQAVRLVGELGDARDADLVAELLQHPAHNVRWQAANSLVQLDLQRGLRELENLQDDAHPHVRAAARQSLENYHATEAC